ncbi:MAG: hypothetical protein WCS31_01355 [Verrucomicrobiae bacterium]
MTPLIIIHYGPARYVRWTLETARRSNPDKRIILLGDSSNRQLVPGGVDFYDFESSAGKNEEEEFQRIFQVVKGARHRFSKIHGVEFWLKFVFRRWFLIRSFLESQKIDAFWTFDSDTLFLANLTAREIRFADVEAMTQCRDQCLNGWVGSRDLVVRYTQSILDQFGDIAFLDAQRDRLNVHAGLAFNEMDAFMEFRRRDSLRVLYGEKPVDNEIFDDALAFGNTFEVARGKVLGRTPIKRIWTDGNSIFARQKESGKFVRLLTCNMSWMPDYMWKRIIAATRGGGAETRGTGVEDSIREENLREISLREPVVDCILNQAKLAVFKMRRALLRSP